MLAFILSHIKLILLLIIGIYEVVIRIVPTVNNLSLIGLIINILKLISDYFNKTK